MPKVSVIMPLYNKPKYVARALNSVLSQTYQDFEVIVVDDDSTDNGPEVVKQYKDPRLRMIRQENAGPGAARNHGIKESKGAFLAFLDADDEWLPEFLKKSLDMLISNPDCALTGCAYYSRAERSDNSQIFRKIGGLTEGPWRLQPATSLREMNYVLRLCTTCSILCKRPVIERYGGFYDKNQCNYGEDIYLTLQIILNHKICRILDPLSWYHTEASELACGRKTKHPLKAFFVDPNPIRQNCSPEYRMLLESWFASSALAAAHDRVSSGYLSDARYLVETFPLMKAWHWEYAKLKFKLLFPESIPYVRWLKDRRILRLSPK